MVCILPPALLGPVLVEEALGGEVLLAGLLLLTGAGRH